MDSSGPTLYPVACAPQAWAAGAPYLLLQASLGLTVKALERQVCFANPILPPNIDEVRIENLGVPDAECDVVVHRHTGGVDVDLLRKQGEIEVIKSFKLRHPRLELTIVSTLADRSALVTWRIGRDQGGLCSFKWCAIASNSRFLARLDKAADSE